MIGLIVHVKDIQSEPNLTNSTEQNLTNSTEPNLTNIELNLTSSIEPNLTNSTVSHFSYASLFQGSHFLTKIVEHSL